MNNFQTVLSAIFIAFFVFGVLIFSGLLPIGRSSNSGIVGNVTVWGTFPSYSLSEFLEVINGDNKNLTVNYLQKPADRYERDLIEAFATGSGPDLFFITPDMVFKNKKFIYPMPYASYPEKAFRDSFIDGAEVFLSKDGTLAFPIVADPLVLYYNKNILTNAGIAKPPRYFDELFQMSNVLTKKSGDGIISQSMIALGSFDNINNAKEIISLLLLNSGNKIVDYDKNQDTYSVVVKDRTPFSSSPVEDAMNFYNEFSNPTNPAYSWNRALPSSLDMFISGRSAFYIGRASELFDIQKKNPNLSFDVTEILQSRATGLRMTTGPVYALATSRRSANPVAAMSVASLFALPENSKQIASALSLVPAQKDELATNPEDPYIYSFYKTAITLRTWIDPDKNSTDLAFREIVQNFTSNRLTHSAAVNKLESQLDLLVKN
jgi:ABC-type glycerol-3-phosphate transport system substrate-binding protein